MAQETFLTRPLKIILVSTILLLTALLLVIVGNPFKKPPTPLPAPQINKIEVSADAKSIINAETKAAIFTIADTQKFLKNSGYFYNPDTFQTTNAKYEGDCFLNAALSNNKDRIVFSTGCLPGDLPQAWVGIYDSGKITKQTFDCSGFNNLITTAFACIGEQNPTPSIYFLIGGSGKNFVWSADDKTIAYEADLGLSGLAETRTIDSATGEILSTADNNGKFADSKTYKNEKLGFEFKYPTNYLLTGSLDEYALFLEKENDAGKANYFLKVLLEGYNTDNESKTFEQFAKDSIELFCVADGPNGGQYCKVIASQPFQNDSGITGYQINTTEFSEDIYEGKIQRAAGPIFTFDISKQTNNQVRGIFFDFDDQGKVLNEKGREKLINQILSTFKFIK